VRSWVGISSFLAIAIITAIYIGFRPVLFTSPLAYDHEQEGMKERIIIKFSHVVAENTPKGMAAIKFANLVRETLGDRVEIQVYPNGILYSDTEATHALERGDIQLIAPASSHLTESFPEWMALDLPFAFANQAAVTDAFRGEIGAQLFHTLERQHLRGLAFWSNGFKQMTSSKQPLVNPSDFAGQRIRILPSALLEAQFHQLRAKPVVIPFNEVYRNLERGTIDGQENTISNIYTKGLYKVQSYMTLSNHGYLGYAVITNQKFWSSLPEDIRAELEAALSETTKWMNDFAVYINDLQLEEIKQTGGIAITELTEQERELWIRRLDPLYDQFSPMIGEDLVEDIRRLRNERIGTSP
jgi:tripartite ATP-independent transporter DctP family solute receptor